MSQIPRYSIEIDEEGYPLFDGLRVQDETLLHELLTHISRLEQKSTRSCLITTCEGEICLLNPFDAPLVAQMVDDVRDDRCEWIFPGNYRETVYYKDLTVDSWNRIHTSIEPHTIPAVLTRKAQAYFFNTLSTRGLELIKQSKSFRNTEPLHAGFWDQAFLDKNDGWELGTHSPVLEHEWNQWQLPKQNRDVLVPGAGRGHDAIFLAHKECRVTAVDYALTAKQEFQKKYPHQPLTYLQSDVFDFLKQKREAYGSIFEHTIFCAIDPSQRQDYVKAVHASLKPGGFWFGIFYLLTNPDGPPFGLSQWELREMTQRSRLFHIKDWHISKHSILRRTGQELWAVFQKC